MPETIVTPPVADASPSFMSVLTAGLPAAKDDFVDDRPPAALSQSATPAPEVVPTPVTTSTTPVADNRPKLPTIGDTPPKVDSATTLDDEPPKDFSPKAAESWKAFKTKAQQRVIEVENKYKAELEAARKATPAAPQDYEDLKKRATEYEVELKRVALERTPEFKKHYDGRFAAAEALAKSSVPKDKADVVARLLKFSDVEGVEAQLEAIASELTPLQAGKLANAVQQYQAAKLDREAALADSQNQLKFAEEHQARTQQQQQEQYNQQVESITKQALELSRSLECFQTKEGDAAHNAGVQTREKFIADFYKGDIKEELKPWVPGLVVDALHYRETERPAFEAKIKELEAVIATYTRGTPSVNGGVPTSTPAGGGKDFMSVLTQGLA